MSAKNLLIGGWCIAVFGISVHLFDGFLESFADATESWQKRFIESNVEYALALFFLLFITLWQGVAVDAFQSSRHRGLARIYRAFVFPLLVLISLFALVPVAFHIDTTPAALSSWLTALMWLVIAGDPSGLVGRSIAQSDWFREKIFKVNEQRLMPLFWGMRGRSGLILLHLAVAAFTIVGVLWSR